MCENKQRQTQSLNKIVNKTKIDVQNKARKQKGICSRNKTETEINNKNKVESLIFDIIENKIQIKTQIEERRGEIYPPKVIESWQCRGKAMETVELADSTGRVSGKYVMIYPPGVPILVPGEKILKETVENISQYLYNGYNVLGLSCNKIIVLKDL